jgi:hypothetical protein
VTSARGRAVLHVLAAHVDGAGFCWLRSETIIRESGYRRRSVFLALNELEHEALVERFRVLRDPTRYRSDLPWRARHGQGPNVYRIGPCLREAAQLIEVDVAHHLNLRDRQRPAPSWAFAVGPATAARCTPDMIRIARPSLQARRQSLASESCTPVTENGPVNEDRAVPREGDRPSATDDLTRKQAS